MQFYFLLHGKNKLTATNKFYFLTDKRVKSTYLTSDPSV